MNIIPSDLQVDGTVSALPGSSSAHLVTKAQLDQSAPPYTAAVGIVRVGNEFRQSIGTLPLAP